MKPQEIERWARDIVDSVLAGQPAEDSRVELKAMWIDAQKAAPRLGGHANASRGENILWLIGVDERNNSLTNVDETEKGDWYKKVEKCFDGFAPRLLIDVNFKINGNTVVALYFDTVMEAPYVVKNPKGGFPEYQVPWREGTDLRAAKRSELLKLLLPKVNLGLLINELEFNKIISKDVKNGYLFKEKEFEKLVTSGNLRELPEKLKKVLVNCYVQIEITNKLSQKHFNQIKPEWLPLGDPLLLLGSDLDKAVNLSLRKIKICLDSIRDFEESYD